MPNLLPGDNRAKRLGDQVYLLSDFLAQHASGFDFPHYGAKAIVHGHCHHKSVLGFDNEAALLSKIGLNYSILDSGCCGMAGAFGFERGDHYDVSIACGERVLLPAVRAAPADTLIIADGFSCREQIAQTTHRRALHVAEVAAQAISQEARP